MTHIGGSVFNGRPIIIRNLYCNGGNDFYMSFEYINPDEEIPLTCFSSRKEAYTPEKIIRSGNRTIVFWADGTKTIVKRGDDEEDSPYHAFTAAVCKKLYGSNSAIHKILEDKTVIQKSGVTASEKDWKNLFERLRELTDRP